jgi:hypothetical protein
MLIVLMLPTFRRARRAHPDGSVIQSCPVDAPEHFSFALNEAEPNPQGVLLNLSRPMIIL